MARMLRLATLVSLLTAALSFRTRSSRDRGNFTGLFEPVTASSYWSGVNTSNKAALQQRLKEGSKKLSYKGLWSFYTSAWVDLPGGCSGKVYDIYSLKCWVPGGDQCGMYKVEGDCYNREHSWPKSWWGGRSSTPAYTDVFHVMPSDGKINAVRSNYAFGEVSNPTTISFEGHKLGRCVTPGFSGTCFEPTDRVKGALARGQLYMSVRYSGEFGCCEKDAVDGAWLKSWALDLFLRWNDAFPPAAWEREVNERGYEWQGNRNPFIDDYKSASRVFL